MNENVVDILIYLYENYMDGEQSPPTDQNTLRDELTQAGFAATEIDKTFDWLDELADHAYRPPSVSHKAHSLRIFSEEEQARLDTNSRGLLMFLEQNEILNPEGPRAGNRTGTGPRHPLHQRGGVEMDRAAGADEPARPGSPPSPVWKIWSTTNPPSLSTDKDPTIQCPQRGSWILHLLQA